MNKAEYLFVDLNGTLIRSDLFIGIQTVLS